jgi:heme-degrading monooxygenase HmoA
MLIILFRSKLTDQAGEDYQAMNQELETLVRQNRGFIDVKSYKAEDGERLTLVWWRDEDSLREWRELMRHRAAQNTGRKKWYQYYKLEVATITRTNNFERKEAGADQECLTASGYAAAGDDFRGRY